MDYSQAGEQWKLTSLFNRIGINNKISVEFGAYDAVKYSNTRYFHNCGWDSHFWDIEPMSRIVKKYFITAENINDIIGENNIPHIFDLLSIDIDGNDYWVWKALEYEPRVVIIEFNPNLSPGKSVTIKYDPKFQFDKTKYFGASFKAMKKLGNDKNYILVDSTELNLIFIHNLIKMPTDIKEVKTYLHKKNVKSGWPIDKKQRKWIEV